MVAPFPIVDTTPALYPEKPITNGIGEIDLEKFPLIEVDMAPSELDSFDPPMVAANGNTSPQYPTNIDLQISASNIDIPSNERKMAVGILKVIESYGVDYEKNGASWKGLESFVPTVMAQVEKQEPIRMILPAFPFKSPNARDKVLGVLPDFGEELALAHLNGLCENVAQVYKPGAEVYISSDGLVYNGELH